eukprot:CAMPEP_0201283290 /NCGR_PEP_ID=MMETSP1317-20130820/8170_1 /ASSEMBLY_ACC=CAM_ASM_000770 /TAXON_ID=187299 /ORGANISM="Undescribed Undescribed, Strain Undescribed" /LENGTH=46 /DNA_ID= /DNA_START= /DNA_END= /DNA_ORIENTATION=
MDNCINLSVKCGTSLPELKESSKILFDFTKSFNFRLEFTLANAFAR